MDVYRDFPHNFQRLETTKMSFSRSMGKVWYIHTMKYCLALKINEILSHEKTWKKLKCILLSEGSQSDKAL